MVKPDAVARGLIGEIISRIERKGLTFAALELRKVSDELAASTTPSTRAKRSSPRCLSSSPLERWWQQSWRARERWRPCARLPGHRPGGEGGPGTIRGDFALETQFNLVHGSDSAESARREIALWFPDYR
ncbi:nucleoside diphosphate kinase [Mycobacterium xenopi 3993]|nr:nucleoside diphosphate kinase [Mycobacterium xenopi 3993]